MFVNFLGISFIAGASKKDIDTLDKAPMFRGASIATDNGGYYGINIAAHELGHM